MTTKVTSSVLTNTAVSAGTYGGISNIPVIVVDAQGRITSASNTTLSASNLTAGTIPSSILGNSSLYIGTTQIALNRASGSQTVGISITGNAATVTNGVYTSGNQTISSVKTFTGAISTANLTCTGSLTGSTDVMNIGSGQIYKDALGNVGIGTSSPGAKLTVAGGVLPTPGFGNIGMSSQLTTGQTGTYDTGTLASISNNLDASSLELSVGSTSEYETGISLTGKYATNYQGAIRFLTSSTERIRIDSSGNVGIGTDSPGGYRFAVAGPSGIRLFSTSDSTTTYHYSEGGYYAGSTGASNYVVITNNIERIKINSEGDIGVGIPAAIAPNSLSLASDYNLSWVWGNEYTYANIFNQTNSASLILASGYQKSATNNGFASSVPVSWAKAAIEIAGSGNIAFYNNTATTVPVGTDITPTESMRITSAGNVGIGNISPAYKLDIDTGVDATAINVGASTSTSSKINIGIGIVTGGRPFIGTGSVSNELEIGTQAAADVILVTNSNEKLRIKNDGKVGIGTNSPTEKLEVSGNIKATGNIISPSINTDTPAVGDISTKVATTEFVYKNSSSKPVIQQLQKGGFASFMFLSEGKVYQSYGSQGYLGYPYGYTSTGTGSQVVGLDRALQLFIPDTSPVVKIGNGQREFTYALTASGNLYTWGSNVNGGCGVGHTSPVYVPTLAATGVVEVYDHTSMNGGDGADGYINTRLIIKKTDGYIYGCGWNGGGGLGLGDTTNRATFTQITAAGQNPKFVGVLGSYYQALVIQKSDNTIWVCGYNGYGQLGVGNYTTTLNLINTGNAWNNGDTSMIIKSAAAGLGYYDAGPGSYSTIILLLDNGTSSLVKSCGCGTYGGLGIGGTGNITTPATLTTWGSARITKLISNNNGAMSVYALTSVGAVWAWGYNSHGQLATINTTQQNTPVLIATNVSDMWVTNTPYTYQYRSQFFIKKADGYVYSCGWGVYGELGIGTTSSGMTTFSRLLLPIGAHNNLKDIGYFSTSSDAGCIVAVTTNNTIYSWGYNGHYGITYMWSGNGYNILTPIQITLQRGE